MKKLVKLLPLVVVASLTACEKYHYVENAQPLWLFNTFVSFRMKLQTAFAGGKTYSEIINTLQEYDRLADPNRERRGEVTSDYEQGPNVYTLNHTNERTKISQDFYFFLKRVDELQESVKYFNPLIGSLSNKWKASLNLNGESDRTPAQLSSSEIEEELAKMQNTSLTIEKEQDQFVYYAQRKGDGLIDLGAVAKGYALDECLEYMSYYTGSTEDYLINAGRSSILVGENLQRSSKAFVIEVSEKNPRVVIEVSNAFISTSGVSEQKVEIDGTTYSHIISPETGSAISNYDQVTVIAPNVIGNGALGDVLSTSLMMSTKAEIEEAETKFGVKIIAIKDGKIEYKSKDITLSN